MLKSLIAALMRLFGRKPRKLAPKAAPSPDLGAGRPFPPNPVQAMPQLFGLTGQFPMRNDGGTTPYFTLAMVESFAGSIAAFGAPRAEGQVIDIFRNEPLFSVIATLFGGDGVMTFGYPDLNGRVVMGSPQVGGFGQQTLTLNYLIATGTAPGVPLPGMIVPFAASYAPDGWLVADGTELPVSQYVPLFEAIAFNFGGGGPGFMLPNLVGRVAVGAGDGPWFPPVAVGQQLPGPPPGLGVTYMICVAGALPPASGNGNFPASAAYLGQVIAYGGSGAPAGWALCDGSLLPVAGNADLFGVLGTTYGGDGTTSFALPDLRGRMVGGLAG